MLRETDTEVFTPAPSHCTRWAAAAAEWAILAPGGTPGARPAAPLPACDRVTWSSLAHQEDVALAPAGGGNKDEDDDKDFDDEDEDFDDEDEDDDDNEDDDEDDDDEDFDDDEIDGEDQDDED